MPANVPNQGEIDATDAEVAQALARLHTLAMGYRGPRESEFHELARRTFRSQPIDETREENEQVPEEIEQVTIREQYQECLAYLLAIAFPLTQSAARRVFKQLSDVLENSEEIAEVQIVDMNNYFNLTSTLAKEVPEHQRQLFDFFHQHLPREDTLNAD